MKPLRKWFALRKEGRKIDSTTKPAALIVKRVWIDRNECTAMTLCESETAGLIEYSKEIGASAVKEHALQRTQHELKSLLEASNVRAMAAFYLETEDGRVPNLDDDEVRQSNRAGNYRWM